MDYIKCIWTSANRNNSEIRVYLYHHLYPALFWHSLINYGCSKPMPPLLSCLCFLEWFRNTFCHLTFNCAMQYVSNNEVTGSFPQFYYLPLCWLKMEHCNIWGCSSTFIFEPPYFLRGGGISKRKTQIMPRGEFREHQKCGACRLDRAAQAHRPCYNILR